MCNVLLFVYVPQRLVPGSHRDQNPRLPEVSTLRDLTEIRIPVYRKYPLSEISQRSESPFTGSIHSPRYHRDQNPRLSEVSTLRDLTEIRIPVYLKYTLSEISQRPESPFTGSIQSPRSHRDQNPSLPELPPSHNSPQTTRFCSVLHKAFTVTYRFLKLCRSDVPDVSVSESLLRSHVPGVSLCVSQ
ncbi:hypothetical protein J6590_085609 [Homalodisca vitripennis]|nr:hypothetical protein J6590_085609 [Homalodisca vitripennis]